MENCLGKLAHFVGDRTRHGSRASGCTWTQITWDDTVDKPGGAKEIDHQKLEENRKQVCN